VQSNQMIRILLVLVLALSFGKFSLGQAAQSAPAPQPRFADTLSKAVVRITSQAAGLNGELNGTGFLIEVPETRLEGNKVIVYLVTNRHVAKAMTPDASGHNVAHQITKMDAVVNLKTAVNGNKAKTIPLPPEGPFQWRFPVDSSIDLAVIPFAMNEDYDAVRIPVSMFFTTDIWEKYRIGPGDKVLTCGYFLHYAGAHRFQPIIREGSLAMVPDDVMDATIGKAKVYLADLHIIPGNSGSPLFLAPTFTLGGMVTDAKGGIPYGLIGLVSGYMWEDNQLTLHAATDYAGTIHANSGIAMIVPVDQLKDLLYSPELQHDRDLALEDYKRTKNIH
jgi:hypothetical protein